MRKMTDTEKVISRMMKENTGTHFLDSGGENGRNWQRNKGRKFIDEPKATVEFGARKRYGAHDDAPLELDITAGVSTFHHLSRALRVSEETKDLTRQFHAFSRRKEQEYDGWTECLDKWLDQKAEEYGEELPEVEWVNSFDGNSTLSQVILFAEVCIPGSGTYIVLQIHGGADVRGGYTKPVFFEQTDYSIWSYNGVTIVGGVKEAKGQVRTDGSVCKYEKRHSWTTDDGYHWYYEGCCGLNAGTQLEAYEATKDESLKGQDVVYVEDDKGYCPFTGEELTVQI